MDEATQDFAKRWARLSKQEGATRHLTTHTAQPVETVAVAVSPTVLSSSPTTQSARHVFQRREDALLAIVNIKHKLVRLLHPPTRRPVAPSRVASKLPRPPAPCVAHPHPHPPTPRCTCCSGRDTWPSGMSRHVARQLWGLPTTTSSIMTAVCQGNPFHPHSH